MDKKRIAFIVDDEEQVRKTLKAHLSVDGYDTVLIPSGEEALNRLGKQIPDVILLDISMPGMDGYEVCRRVKQNPDWRHIPVVLVTAMDPEVTLIEGLEAGADEYLNKPVRGRELRLRVRNMVRMKQQYDDIRESVKMRDNLAELIIHDLRNPLAAMKMYCELVLAHKMQPPKSYEILEKALEQGGRLESLLNDLLLQAKIEHNKLNLQKEEVNLNLLALESNGNFADIAKLKNIDFVVDVPEESRPVSVDVKLFRRVFDNLLSNSFKFVPAGTQVKLKIDYPWEDMLVPPHQIRIQVIDEGPGIPDDNKEKIFDKFTIADMRKRGGTQAGFGLGLSFCKLAVEAHGGRIYVTDNKPRGSIFTVEI